MKSNKFKMFKNTGITLIALVVTIIVLLILAAITITLVAGNDGIFGKSNEASFKFKMSAIAEELNIYTTGLIIGGENSKIYAGELLKQIIQDEELEIEEKQVQDIRKMLKNVGNTEEKYTIVHEGELYYVSQSSIANNEEQVKWCQEIGIKIWEYDLQTGIKVVNGKYENVNGVYMCTPKLNTGFKKENTRYLKLDESGNIVPGNWINKKPDDDWYDYDGEVDSSGNVIKKPTWANLFVESNGVESAYVWIPRYVYKKDTENSVTGNERMDVKFVDIDNSYTDAVTNEKILWSELQNQEYKLPEAFWWDNNGNGVEDSGEQLPGYWMSKYQLSELSEYAVDFSTAATSTSITIQNIKTNTTKTIAKYTYAVNGNIVHQSTDGSAYTIKDLARGNRTINVTILDENGEIIGSMTKIYEAADVNVPEIKGFDQDTTFYVYWDEDGNEYNHIPISQEPPIEWYDYTTANWANIVTRNNGVESYFVWIPRYQYAVDSTSERTYVRFIKGTGGATEDGYKVPEAFWWDNDGDGVEDEGEQLTGYWMSKYQLSEQEATPRITAEMVGGSNSIQIQDITGTLITEAETAGTNIRYEYYLNGIIKKDNGTSSTENYTYTGLKADKTYTVNIIARNKDTNAYIGSITKKITTVGPNAPDISKFNPETTYYVVYEGETEKRVSMKDGVPPNWYDYSNQKWANIVTTSGETETYFVWIPRYEYSLDTVKQRSNVKFIKGTGGATEDGYKVPEAFWWDNDGDGVEDEGEQLTGYWITKYQLSEKK